MIIIIINKVLARKNSYPPLSFWDIQGTVEPLVVLDSGPKLWKRSTLRGCVRLHVVYFALVIVPVMRPYSLWNLRNCTSELKICECLVMIKSMITFHCFSIIHLHNALILLLRPECSQGFACLYKSGLLLFEPR